MDSFTASKNLLKNMNVEVFCFEIAIYEIQQTEGADRITLSVETTKLRVQMKMKMPNMDHRTRTS